jgi:hypothetical protein
MKPHKHAELIKAWADGAVIQRQLADGTWEDRYHPDFRYDLEYRVTPFKPDKANVGGRMVAVPVTLPKEPTAKSYWTITASGSVDSLYCTATDYGRKYTSNNNMFATQQDAIEWRDAWQELEKSAIDGRPVGLL